MTAQSLANISLKQALQKGLQFRREGVWKFHIHGECHSVNFMLVFGFMLSERAVTSQKFEKHAAQGEPVGTAVIGRPLLQHLGSHVPMGANARMRLLFGKIAGKTKI